MQKYSFDMHSYTPLIKKCQPFYINNYHFIHFWLFAIKPCFSPIVFVYFYIYYTRPVTPINPKHTKLNMHKTVYYSFFLYIMQKITAELTFSGILTN